MYKNWLKNKIQKRNEQIKISKEIREKFLKFSTKDWDDFRDTDYRIKLVENPNSAKFFESETEKVRQIIDGSFWNLDNPDFEKLTNEQIGKKGKEILELLKPFYRKNLVKSFNTELVYINLTKEIKSYLTKNYEEYRIEPELWCKPNKDFIIDCNNNNIWSKEKSEKSKANIEKAWQLGYLKYNPPSASSNLSAEYICLKDLYEEKIENGFSAKDLHGYVKSNDQLKHVFFLYVVKRAQRRDESAAKLLVEMYEKAVERKAEFWIRRIENNIGTKFKQGSELGLENVKRVSKIFLRMLITGDDPEAIFDYIKQIDDAKNIELFFTRKLGKKIKDLVKLNKELLSEKAEEYKKAEKIGPLIELALEKELEKFPQNEVESLFIKIQAAKLIAKYPRPKERTSYRTYIPFDKLNSRLKELANLYFEIEDFFIEKNIKGFPCLEDSKFHSYTSDEKTDFERTRDMADRKADANEKYRWYTYINFIDDDELSDYEKKIYDIYKKYEKIFNIDYAMLLEGIRLELATYSDPYSWFSLTNWFNDKLYNAAKNNNFTNWLLKGNPPKPSAIESMLIQWLRSKEFIMQGKIKDEYLDIDISRKDMENEYCQDFLFDEEQSEEKENFVDNNYQTPYGAQQEKSNIIDRIINKYLFTRKNKNKRNRNKELLKLWINRKSRNELINYAEIGTIFQLKKRQVIKICKDFENFAKKEIKRN